MRILAFDTETVPCLAMGARVYGVEGEAPDAYRQIETARLAETEHRSTFLKPFMHRIVALGMVLIDTEKGDVAVKADAGEHESGFLRLFHSWLAGSPVLVSWNGLSFDLPVIRYRAMYHGLPLPRLCVGNKSWEKYDSRFSDVAFDLCDLLSGYGRSTALKLKEAAALCGIPAKTEGTAEDVLGRFRSGDHDGNRRYVGEDAQVTARVFLRWQLSRGRMDKDAYEKLDALVAHPEPAPALALA